MAEPSGYAIEEDRVIDHAGVMARARAALPILGVSGQTSSGEPREHHARPPGRSPETRMNGGAEGIRTLDF